MAVDVVDLLEVIEVDHDETEGMSEAGAPMHLPSQHRLEGASVDQSGQGIGGGRQLEGLLEYVDNDTDRDRRSQEDGPPAARAGDARREKDGAGRGRLRYQIDHEGTGGIE